VTREVVMTADLAVEDRDLWDSVRDLELPLVLIDLSDFTVAFSTKAFLEQVKMRPEKVLHTSISDLFEESDRNNSHAALQALADGRIDYFRSHRQLKRTPKSMVGLSFWVCAINVGKRQYALAEATARLDAHDSPLVEYFGYTPLSKVVGLTDPEGLVTTVSNNVKSILGITSEKLIGRHLLRTDEQRELCRRLVSEHVDTEGYSISLPADSLNHLGLGGTQNVRCIVSALADSSSLFFLLVPGADGTIGPQSDRVAEPEHRLWRIATEVQASGIFDFHGKHARRHSFSSTRFTQYSSVGGAQPPIEGRTSAEYCQ
jgi:hypothetical protein